MKLKSDILPRLLLAGSILLLAFAYGYNSRRAGWFPHDLLVEARAGLLRMREDIGEKLPFYYSKTTETEAVVSPHPEEMQPGLTLLTSMGANKHQTVRVIDADGTVVAKWGVDWFDYWTDTSHLPDDVVPKALPGTIVQGVLVTEDGGIIFNFDGCGLIRLDACGEVVWRLAKRTHHSLCRDEQGNIWTSARILHEKPVPGYSRLDPPFDEYTILEVSPDGELLQEISIHDLLLENGMRGVFYLSNLKDHHTNVKGDLLHVNDVEVFPSSLGSGDLIAPGDVMVSMRNINMVAIFDLKTRKLKHVIQGPFVRQHDPDFVNGHTITLFDNNNIGDPSKGIYSRILEYDLATHTSRVLFSGSAQKPFFSDIMGQHQNLANGNLLIVESRGGRILEVDPQGRIVWQYRNFPEPGLAGLISDARRLPPNRDREFFARTRRECEARRETGAKTGSGVKP